MNKEELTLDIKDIKPNPNNPRIIRDSNFKTLVRSLKDFPEMLEARQIVIDENNIILGGNMRYKALTELKVKKVPVIKVTGLTNEKKDEFIVKDNVNYGVWDWDILANDYEPEKLKEYGLNVWQPQEALLDDIDLDFGNKVEDDAEPVSERQEPTEHTMVVEFDIEDYPEAFKLSKELQKEGHDLGAILLNLLENNYENR